MASTLHIAGLALEADWVEAWGTWAGGLGTIAAVLWAVYALRREGRRSEEERKAAQALEARTVITFNFGNSDEETDFPSIRHVRFRVAVGNFGNFPITHVRGHLAYNPTGVVTPDAGPVPVLAAGQDGVLQFSVTQESLGTWHEGPHKQIFRELLNDIDPFSLSISWNDVHGQRWKREYGGQEEPTPVSIGPYPSKQPGLGHRVRAATKALRGS